MNFDSADIELICVDLKLKLEDQNFQLHTKLQQQAMLSLILTMRQILPSKFSDYKFESADEKSAFDGLIGYPQTNEQFESNSQRVSLEQDQCQLREQLTEENQSLRKELEVKSMMLHMKFSGDIIKQVGECLKVDKQQEQLEWLEQLKGFQQIQYHNDNIEQLKSNNKLLAEQVQECKIEIETLNLELQQQPGYAPPSVQQSIQIENSGKSRQQINEQGGQQINEVVEQYEVEQVDLIVLVLAISGVLLIALYYQQ